MEENSKLIHPAETSSSAAVAPKAPIFPILAIGIITAGAIGGGVWFYSEKNKKETPVTTQPNSSEVVNTTTTTTTAPKEKKYVFKKLNGVSGPVSSVHVKDTGDYIGYSYTQDGQEHYKILKDDKVIEEGSFEDHGYLLNIPGTNYFYLHTDRYEPTGYFLNINNQGVTEEQFDVLYPETKDIIVVKKNGEYALIDIKGNRIVPFGTYDNIMEMGMNADNDDDECQALHVIKNKKVGVIDGKGKIIVPLNYTLRKNDIDGEIPGYVRYHEGKAFIEVYNNKKETVLFDLNGKELFTTSGEIIYSKGYIFAQTKNEVKRYNYSGKLLDTLNIKGHVVERYLDNGSIIYREKDTFYERKIDNTTIQLGKIVKFVYPTDAGDMDGYAFSNNIYVLKEDKNYNVYTFNDYKLKGTYEGFKAVAYEEKEEAASYYIVLNDKKAGVIDAATGKLIVPVEYDLKALSDDGEYEENDLFNYFILKKGTEKYYIDNNGVFGKVDCETDDIGGLRFYGKDYIELDGKLYDSNLKPYNIEIFDGGETLDGIYEFFRTDVEPGTTVFYKDGKLLDIVNEKGLAIEHSVAWLNDKIYYQTNNGIYYLTYE